MKLDKALSEEVVAIRSGTKGSLLLSEQELLDIFQNGSSSEVAEGERHIKCYLGNMHFTFRTTKSGVLERAMRIRSLNEKSTRSIQLKTAIDIAWPLSGALCRRRVYVLQFAIDGDISGSEKSKCQTFEAKSGHFELKLFFQARSKNGRTEVVIISKGLIPHKPSIVLSTLDKFLQSIGFQIYDYRNFSFLWMRAIAGQEWNNAHFKLGSFYKPQDNAVHSYFEPLIAKGTLYPLHLFDFNDYLTSTTAQFYSYVVHGDKYKVTDGTYLEDRKYGKRLSEDFFSQSCPCIDEFPKCKGSFKFLENDPCSFRL